MAYTLIFLLKKMWVAFAFSYSHFFSRKKNNKITTELDTVLTRPVNILTTNELIKLTMLWAPGPCLPIIQQVLGTSKGIQMNMFKF